MAFVSSIYLEIGGQVRKVIFSAIIAEVLVYRTEPGFIRPVGKPFTHIEGSAWDVPIIEHFPQIIRVCGIIIVACPELSHRYSFRDFRCIALRLNPEIRKIPLYL